MGEILAKLFVDPSTLPGGAHCIGTKGVADAVSNVLAELNNTAPYNITGVEGGNVACSQGGWGFIQVLFLLVVYAKVLSWASNLISDGSELLLLVPSLRGIVGSVVLPILGAVPDGAIVLFSGLGQDAKEQVAVGVGTLAGSTIMLLTIPWSLAILAGRVSLDARGTPVYKKPRNAGSDWQKLAPYTGSGGFVDKLKYNLLKTGVAIRSQVHLGGKIMLATSLVYVVIQGPAFEYMHKYHSLRIKHEDEYSERVAHGENLWSLIGLILALIAFVGYLFYQVKYADNDDAVEKAKESAIGRKLISLSGAFALELREIAERTGSEEDGLIDDEATTQKLKDFLYKFYHKYDIDGDGRMDATELRLLFEDLNERMSKEQFDALMKKMDRDGSGFIEFDEFVVAMCDYLLNTSAASKNVALNRSISGLMHTHSSRRTSINMESPPLIELEPATPSAASPRGNRNNGAGAADAFAEEGEDGDDDEDEEGDDESDSDGEEEIPEEFQKLTPEQQQRAIKLRSFVMMAIGTVVVLLFSDPMCDVLSEVGNRTHIKPFYVAFILAPLASNASELIAAYNYALKKTKKTVNISFATLEGAAIMNNTFCLGIFLLIIFAKRDIPWTFSAETISILLIQVLMVLIAQKKTQRLLDALIVISLYPLSLVVVYVLENVAKID